MGCTPLVSTPTLSALPQTLQLLAAPDDESRCLLAGNQRFAFCLTGARLRVKGRLGNSDVSEHVLRPAPAANTLPYSGAVLGERLGAVLPRALPAR